MHGHQIHHIDDPGPARINPALRGGMLLLGIVGMLVFAYGAFLVPEEQRLAAWNGFLVSYLFFFFLAMTAAFFLALQYVVGAKWFIAVQRIPEAIAEFVVKGGWVFPLIGLLGTGYLYVWAQPGAEYPYPGTMKRDWLSPGTHIIKVFVLVGLLTAITWMILRACRSTHRNPEVLRLTRVRSGIIFLVVFSLAFSLFGFDVVMSLDPKWFSTMFGVYCFAGGILSFYAVMMLMTFWLRKRHPDYISEDRQVHDVGTYVMAFSVFWIYIAFSQFMLIWYANIPDETFYYIRRGYPSAGFYDATIAPWLFFIVAIPLLKWVIPFFLLMPPSWRTSFLPQVIVCLAILVGQLMDLWWMVVPAQQPEHLFPNLVNIMTFLGVMGFFGWSVLGTLASRSVLPMEDPELLSSVNGEYLHA